MVRGDDGVSTFPSEIISGSTVTDSAGTSYVFAAGTFRFPIVNAPGNYRLELTPSPSYRFPSTADPAVLQTLPTAPFTLNAGSFAAAYAVAAPSEANIDVPAGSDWHTTFLAEGDPYDAGVAGRFRSVHADARKPRHQRHDHGHTYHRHSSGRFALPGGIDPGGAQSARGGARRGSPDRSRRPHADIRERRSWPGREDHRALRRGAHAQREGRRAHEPCFGRGCRQHGVKSRQQHDSRSTCAQHRTCLHHGTGHRQRMRRRFIAGAGCRRRARLPGRRALQRH